MTVTCSSVNRRGTTRARRHAWSAETPTIVSAPSTVVPLAERRERHSHGPSCSAFHGALAGSRLVRCQHVRDLGEELRKVAAEVRVPGVRAHEVRLLDSGGDRRGRRTSLCIGRLGGTASTGRRGHPRVGLRSNDVDVDQLAQRARQVLDVHAGAAVHLRRGIPRVDQHGLQFVPLLSSWIVRSASAHSCNPTRGVGAG